MSNPFSDFFKSQEERKKVKELEQLRRKGETFIRVRYVGNTIPQIDSEGMCYNIRPHGLKDIEAYESTNINNGSIEWKTRVSARTLHFYQTHTGDIEADIWDDPDRWNRRFIAVHPEIEVLDQRLKEEILEEKNKPFKAELSRREELEREIASKVQELDKLDEEENNGVNKPTPDVDSPRVPRVATRRGRKRNTPAVQSGSPDTEHGGERAESPVRQLDG